MTQFFITEEIMAYRAYPDRIGGILRDAIESGWEVAVVPAPFHLRDKSLPGGGCVMVLFFKPYQPIAPTKTVEDILGEWGLP